MLKTFFYISKLDIPVTVVMPVVAPIMKVENCKKFGANVLIHGANIGESRDRYNEIVQAVWLFSLE